MNEIKNWNVWLDFRLSPSFATVVENATLEDAKLEAMRRAIASGWEESARCIHALPVDYKPAEVA